MRIGIDARFLTHPQAGGFKTYTEQLIHALYQIDNKNQYIIYVDRPFSECDLSQSANFTYKVVPGTMPIIGMPFREQYGLRRNIQRDKLDVVHFLCNTATINIPNKTIITLHDTIQVSSATPFRFTFSSGQQKDWAITTYSKWAIKQAVKSANRIIAVSNQEKAQIMRFFQLPENRIVVTHEAPNSIFSPACGDAKAAMRKHLCSTFGVCGRFVLGVGYNERKNIPLLIQSFSIVAASHSDICLVVVAANENKRQCFQHICAKLRLDGRVIILGKVSNEDLVALYNLADTFVFPSEREGFGLPPLEAMACGVPTIAMRNSTTIEVVADGAFLVDGKDVKTWADAIARVIMDEDLRSDLVQCGLKRASEMTWQKCAEATLQIYNAVVEGTPNDA